MCRRGFVRCASRVLGAGAGFGALGAVFFVGCVATADPVAGDTQAADTATSEQPLACDPVVIDVVDTWEDADIMPLVDGSQQGVTGLIAHKFSVSIVIAKMFFLLYKR